MEEKGGGKGWSKILMIIKTINEVHGGAAQLVLALTYKPEGRGFFH